MSCLIGQKPLGDQEKVRNQVPAGIKIWAEKKGHSLLVITGTTRSSNAGFYFRLNCFFCARFITDRKQQRGKVHMVQCKSKEVSIANADAILRQQNDEWSLEMKGRLEFVKNRLGEDTIYHETDTAVFNPAKKKEKIWNRYWDFISRKRGGSTINEADEVYEEIVKYLHQNDD